ncbi:MAG: hypothetical protein HOQ16_10270 [Gemmatimonadaceae bacterium]|nr:hypothetical protein [Gemmatimonadaceae bacterium]
MTIRRTYHAALALVAIATSTGLVACDRIKNPLLEVSTPDIVTPDKASSAAGAQSFFIAAQGDFARLVGGDRGGSSPLGLNLTGGLLADELISTRTGTEHIDNRSIVPATFPADSWRQVGAAHTRITRAIKALETYPPATGGNDQLALLHAYEGMTLVLVAEHYCNGVPLWNGESDLNPATKTFSTAELYNAAIAEFNKALSLTQVTNTVNFATIGKARATLDAATPATLAASAASAAALVAAIPTDYKFNVVFGSSTAGVGNAIYDWANSTKNFGAVDKEGGNGLDYISSGDPRIKVDPTKVSAGQDGTRTPALNQYPKLDAPVTVASGIEARMIQAESELANGNPNWINTLNSARATIGLGPLVPAATAAGQVDQLFRERGFWMYLTAHRLGDMRRLVRQYGRGIETVYPTGSYFKGGTYGTDAVLPPHQDEFNNPNWSGCTDKAP